MTPRVAFVQDVFPAAVIYNIWNWIDVTERRSRAAVFLIDFLDLHDAIISERCDHLFTCSFSKGHLLSLGHRAAYAGAGVCEISSLLPDKWTIKDLSVGLFWSQDELIDTNKICAQMAKKVFAEGSNSRNLLIRVPLYRESAPLFTIIIIIIVLLLFFVVFGFAILAYLLIRRSYTQKFIILTSLNRSATNYTYSDFITRQIITKCKDMHSISEHLKPLAYKHKDASTHVLSEDIKRPSSKAATVSDKDWYVDRSKSVQKDEAIHKQSRSLLTFTSTAIGENEPSNIPHKQGGRKSDSNTLSVFGLSLTPSSKVCIDHSVQYKPESSNACNHDTQNSQLASTQQLSNMSQKKQKVGNNTCDNNINNSDGYTIDSVTSEDQRKVCSFLPKQPNIIQTLQSTLRYLSDYTIENISSLNDRYSYEIHKYKNRIVLFSQIVMPIWTSAQVFSMALDLQNMSDSKDSNFATIEGVFILVVDKIYDSRYILPRELVGIYAFNKNSSFHFCMITNIDGYIPLTDLFKKIQCSYNRGGLNSKSFCYNTNLIYELLKTCGQKLRDKNEVDNELKGSQIYQDSGAILEPNSLNTSINEHIMSSVSSFESAHMSKNPSVISSPPIQELREMSSRELVSLLNPDKFTISGKPAKRFVKVIHALNAQHISRSSTITFLQLISRQSRSTIENNQQQQQQDQKANLDSMRDENITKSVSSLSFRQNKERKERKERKVVLYSIQSHSPHNKYDSFKDLSQADGVDELSDVDRYDTDLLQASSFGNIQSTKRNGFTASYSDCDDTAVYSHHKSEKKVYADNSCLQPTPADDMTAHNTFQLGHSMLPPIYPKHTASSTIKLDIDSHNYIETHHNSLIDIKTGDTLLPFNPQHKSCDTLPGSISDNDPFENYDLQEVIDTMAYLGSSVRERVAQLVIKELINNKSSFRTIQYLDMDCILININPISNDLGMIVEIGIKIEPFSILLRNINTIPRPIIAKTDSGNTSNVDMYVRVVLIYLELITLLECTQSDLEELSIFLSELRADVNYGSVFKHLLPLIKNFPIIISRERLGDNSDKGNTWRDLLMDAFT